MNIYTWLLNIPLFILCAILFPALAPAAGETKAGSLPDADSATNLFIGKTVVKQAWDSYAEAGIDFSRQLKRIRQKGTFDPNSIRVFEMRDDGGRMDAPLPARWIPGPGFDEKTNAAGRVIWQVKGDGILFPAGAVDAQGWLIDKNTGERKHRFKTAYRIYFDLKEHGPKEPLFSPELPETGNIFPNGGFELAAKPGIPDLMPYFRPENMVLDDKVAHAGKYALRIGPEYKDAYCAFRVPDLRVEGGKNYVFSFWGRARGIDTRVAYFTYVLWSGPDRVQLMDQNKGAAQSILMSRDSDFNWELFRVTVQTPKEACFGTLDIMTYIKIGNLWADDFCATPQFLPDDPLEAERFKIETTTYPDLALMQEVRTNAVTAHVPWLKPVAGGTLKTLYLAGIRNDTDLIMRTPVELLQRLDLDLTFVPALKHRLPDKPPHAPEYADDLEPYSIEAARDKLKARYDLIILDSLDFKGVQPEFASLLAGAANAGAGLLLLRCASLPGLISNAMQNAVPAPEDFNNLPVLNPDPALTNWLSQVVQLFRPGKGRMAVLSAQGELYPCTPRGEDYYNADPYSKAFHGWEYRYILWLKVIRWLAGREHPSLDARLEGTNALAFSAWGRLPPGCRLEINIRDSFGRIAAQQCYPDVFAGTNRFSAGLPRLPGGTCVAEYRLLDNQGKIHDCGAYAWKESAPCAIAGLATDKPYYRKAEPVKVRVAFAAAPDQAELQVRIRDTHDRIIQAAKSPLSAGQTNAEFTFTLPPALSILHSAEAALVRAGAVISEQMTEFSRPDAYPGDDEYGAYLWSGRQLYLPGYYTVCKDAGFDSVIMEADRADYLGPKITRANLRPWGYSPIGELAHKGVGQYHGDDRIREPCFSNPAWWRERETNIVPRNAAGMAYFGIRDCILTDELDIGPVVCFCEDCLRTFRSRLGAQYKDLKALNAEWGTAFTAWDQVKPLTLKETLEQKKSIASWVDHKMFMTAVFAGMIDRAAALYRPVIPGIKVGLSGTQNPNFSYNWWEFMKSSGCIANYGGIQGDLIRSFQRPGLRAGRWTGGYALPWTNAEKYVRNEPWQGLFNGNNCYFFFHGGCWGTFGDFRINANTRMAMEEVQAIKSGADKLLFNADHHFDGILVHYSHASLFAAMATKMDYAWGQALFAWKCLLDDMGLSFRFAAPEQIEDGRLDDPGIKVLILPASLCLSRAEVEAVRKFVKRGGLVIADYCPGIYNQHGNPDAAGCNRLFGADRVPPGTNGVRLAAGQMKIAESGEAGLRERALRVLYADEGLQLTTGKACAGFDGKPALVLNETGKGRTFLLDCGMHEYAKSEQAGVGGEEQLIGRGDPALTTPLREMVADILAGAGIKPAVTLQTGKGVNFQPLVQTHLYRAGNLRYVGILKSSEESKPILPEEHVQVMIDFGSKAHVYDVRAGRYLGYESRVEADIAPALARLYALLPYRVLALTARADDAARGEPSLQRGFAKGEAIKVQLAVKASEPEVGRHIVVLRFYAPDQKEIPHYRTKAVLENGTGTVTFVTALNDPPGQWTLEARDVASGITGRGSLSLR